MRKIRVLQVCGGLSAEGIGVFLLNTMENIDTTKFDITFALGTKYKQSYESRIEEAGGTIIRTYEIGEGLLGKFRHFQNLIRLIKNNGPFDVVHTHMDFFNGINLIAAFICGIKKRISHAHVAAKPNLKFSEKIYYSVMRMLIKTFTTEKMGCSLIANENVHGPGKIIYNGIDLQKFKEQKTFPDDVVINKEIKNLITIGRIEPPKNPYFTIKLIKEIAAMKKDFHFYWVGTGSLYEEIAILASQYNITDHITFLKNRMDIDQLLFHMDVFILPSIYEGLGIVLVEAQASNIKCLTSTAVPPEVNIGLCRYLDLSLGEKVWAEEIIGMLNSGSLDNFELNEDKVKLFDVKYMVRQLEQYYASK